MILLLLMILLNYAHIVHGAEVTGAGNLGGASNPEAINQYNIRIRQQNLDSFQQQQKLQDQLERIEQPIQQSEPTTSDSDSKDGKPTTIYLEGIELLGSTVVPLYEIQKITRAYTHRSVTFEELKEMTDRLTDLFIERNYITSRVFIPPQTLEEGILKLKVVEGVIHPITLEEGDFFKRRAIFPRMRVNLYDKLNTDQIKADLARINENPDVNLSALLVPGPEPGETELRYVVKDKLPFHIVPFVDNLGRNSIGRERYGISLVHNNLLGFGDTDIFTTAFTERSKAFSNSYLLPLGRTGTQVGLGVAYSDLRLGGALSPLRLKSSVITVSPLLTQEILRIGDKLLLEGGLAFDIRNLSTNIGGRRFARTRLRVLKPSLSLQQFDSFGATSVNGELGIGIDGFDGSRAFRANNRFLRLTGSAVRLTRLPYGITSLSRMIGQYTDDRLNGSEQFQVGGTFTVRGYEEGVLLGDSGLVLSQEFQFPMYFIPKTWKIPINKYGLPASWGISNKEAVGNFSFRDAVKLATFIDYGSTFINGRTPLPKRSYVAGTGVGLRIKLTNLLTARFDLGIPIVRNLPDRQDLTIHFGLTSSIP